MKTYKTVRDAKRAYDKFLGANGDSRNRAHYVRPDKTKGPMVEYDELNMSVAVDRDKDGWILSKAYYGSDLPPYIVFGIKSFGTWESCHA